MITTNPIYEEMFNSVARQFVGRVELLEGSTLIDIFEHDGALISFTVDRVGDPSKFFGYGITQMLTMRLRDKERSINIQKGQRLQAAFGIENDYVYSCPVYIIEEVTRDENTNELTVVAYDPIHEASKHKVMDLTLPQISYNLKTFAYACGSILGMPVNFINIPEELLELEYTAETANFDGNETIREALDDLAEMFGAVYYMCNDWNLTFKRLDIAGEPVLAIDKSKYFSLSAKTAHTLANIMSVTELGDNVTTTSEIEGDTQYLRENAFLTLREDIADLLESIFAAVKGLTIYQLDCKHRGDFRLEIGDKVSFTTKDDNIIKTYVLNDSTTYSGGLASTMAWEYTATSENEGNPTSLGEALQMTYAKVDKVNQEIELLAKRVDETDIGQLTEEMASLKLTTDSITAEVSELEQNVNTLENKVNTTLTSENLSILVSQSVNSVKTSTGFTFDAEGLKIEKTNAPTQTQITENGMVIYNANAEAVLTVNNTGVNAKDLHANTYLIIGNRCRFENFGSRIGCFWIG